jgi:hypothetical protein
LTLHCFLLRDKILIVCCLGDDSIANGSSRQYCGRFARVEP